MIHLFTGLPGAGKTLNAIKRLLEAPQYKGRPLYHYRVKEPTWQTTELSDQDVHDWRNLPSNSVIFLDEVQKVFRVRKKNVDIPDYITGLEDHRHNGIDFICTSQYPMQTDVDFRKQVGKHWHVERAFGFSNLRVFEWNKCVNDPAEDYFARKDATMRRLRLDKKYFGMYKSAEVHTHKPEIPRKLIYVIIGFLIFAGLAWQIPTLLNNTSSDAALVDDATDTVLNSLTTAQPTIQQETLLSSTEQYLDQLTPVIKSQPNTARIYEALHVPVSMPRLNCLSGTVDRRTVCKCYSQQATKLNVTERACLNYVNNGYSFDYTVPDYGDEKTFPSFDG